MTENIDKANTTVVPAEVPTAKLQKTEVEAVDTELPSSSDSLSKLNADQPVESSEQPQPLKQKTKVVISDDDDDDDQEQQDNEASVMEQQRKKQAVKQKSNVANKPEDTSSKSKVKAASTSKPVKKVTKRQRDSDDDEDDDDDDQYGVTDLVDEDEDPNEELEGLDTSNIITTGRRTRGARVKYTFNEDDDNDDGEDD
ncbi:hypothetical protein MP228_006914 [Amoeboaphelidium protococcarum]|nr:hypothetical protein MP228_006914 [Amoeboaphelidium protococcarum]